MNYEDENLRSSYDLELEKLTDIMMEKLRDAVMVYTVCGHESDWINFEIKDQQELDYSEGFTLESNFSVNYEKETVTPLTYSLMMILVKKSIDTGTILFDFYDFKVFQSNNRISKVQTSSFDPLEKGFGTLRNRKRSATEIFEDLEFSECDVEKIKKLTQVFNHSLPLIKTLGNN